MKRSGIKIGHHYKANVDGLLTTVRLDGIEDAPILYRCVNLVTGKKCTFMSAAKFRSEVEPDEPDFGQVNVTQFSNSAFTNDITAKLSGIIKPSDTVAGYSPTKEQQDILEASRQPGLTCLVIGAGAGTGKTSTLKMLEEVLPGQGQYTAFNASLVAESKAKFRKAACNTTHSLAFRSVGYLYGHRLGGSRIRAGQVADMLGLESIELTMPSEPETPDVPKHKVISAPLLASMVNGAIRKFCSSADEQVQLNHFSRPAGIDFPDKDGQMNYTNSNLVRAYLLPFAHEAWKDITEVSGNLPFSHDCYVKIWQLGKGQDAPVIHADYILIDESQDLSPVLLDILERQSALLIFVGDDNQQIYEWRGAVNAMKAFPDAPRKLLSQSFRFGQGVADVANSILSGLSERTDMVMKGLESIPTMVVMPGGAFAPEPDCVLTRTNAMAVGTVLAAFQEGKRPHLIGGGAEVVKFMRAAKDLQEGKSTSHPELCCFESWSEVQEYCKNEDGEDLKTMVKLIDEFGVKPIIAALEGMPAEANSDLVVCTAHKSKGREWGVVQLASDFPPANRMEDSDVRLLYVAATRAQHVLDLSVCTPFRANKDKVTGEEIQPIKIKWTSPRSTKEQLSAFLIDKPKEVKPVASAPSVEQPTDQPSHGKPFGSVREFSWAKHGNEWAIRGPKGAMGLVTVTKKSGGTSQEWLGPVIKSFGDNDFYQVSK